MNIDKKQRDLFEQGVQELCSTRQIAGVMCVAADRDGVIYEKGFGTRDIATGLPMTGDTVFFIASMTKAVVAASVMQLVEKGQLDLDEDVGNYLPEYKNPLVLDGWDEYDVPRLRLSKRPLTLRRILSMTSGFSSGINPNVGKWIGKFRVPSYGPASRRKPLAFDPGEQWEYSSAPDIAMECINQVTGLTLEAYFRKYIFDPLGMDSTSFKLSKAMEARRAEIHFKRDGKLISNTAANQIIDTAYPPAHDYGDGEGHGGLYSTANDYIKFVRMLINGGTCDGVQILKPESVAEIGRNQIGELYMKWPSEGFGGSDLTYYAGPNDLVKWGLGLTVNEQETECGRMPGGMSWFGGYDQYFWADPLSNLCGVVMLENIPSATPESKSVFYSFEKMFHGKL